MSAEDQDAMYYHTNYSIDNSISSVKAAYETQGSQDNAQDKGSFDICSTAARHLENLKVKECQLEEKIIEIHMPNAELLKLS